VTKLAVIDIESAIYKGVVRHRRFSPTNHEFSYPLFMMFLKLDELPAIYQRFWQIGEGRLNWARFRRSDYLTGECSSLTESVLQKMNELCSEGQGILQGDVYFMGNLRYMGFYFSPLNLYFLKQGDRYTHMLAEVSNTPWNQRHHYLVDLAANSPSDKEFHVSPFNPMSQQYHWRIVPPGSNGKCSLHIENHNSQSTGEKVFDATLSLRRHELNQKELNHVLLKSPVQTLSILKSIYWQALKLIVKKTPLYSHKNKKSKTATVRKKGMT